MKVVYTPLLLTALWFPSCYSPGNQPQKQSPKSGFVYKETIVTGKDSGMISLSGFRKVDIRDVLSQHWEVAAENDASSQELLFYENGSRVFPELSLFKDSTVLENPRSNLRTGTWQVILQEKKPTLILSFPGNEKKQYIIRNINATSLHLVIKAHKEDSLHLYLYADAVIHKGMLNDPFYPSNNKWRVKPLKSEDDSAIRVRVKECIKFFALYFRDNIKRQKKTILFAGFPEIFNWYSGGIGLPDKEEIDESWINCFYNKPDALKGYELLRRLIVDYEFKWPEKAPNWVYQTHSVLEQMYHKL